MDNIFFRNGRLGIEIRDQLIAGKIDTKHAIEAFREMGETKGLTKANINKIVAKAKKQLTRQQLVIVDSQPNPINAQLTAEIIENRLIRKPEETVNLNHVIDNSLLELERVKLEFGMGTREHLASLKLQTDIALKFMQIAPNDDKIDMGQIMKSFDWITDFIETLHEKYAELNIRSEYIIFVEQRQKEALV